MMNKKTRLENIIAYFSNNMPAPQTELNYTNSYKLIVAVILSAQCTDVRVNKITPELFQRFPDVQSLANAKQEEILHYIKSCSYPNSKATHLSEMAKMLLQQYHGQLPETTEELMQLPGVGRKTAHVLAAVLYNKPVLAVDTHVHRVAARIGLTWQAKNPLATEKQLVKIVPEKIIPDFHHWLILHGRYVCKAKAPACANCGINAYCKFYSKEK